MSALAIVFLSDFQIEQLVRARGHFHPQKKVDSRCSWFFKLVGRIFSSKVGFFFLVCKVSSSSVLIFIGDNGGVVLVGGGGCVIFLLSSSTRNLANSFSAVTTNDDGGKDGTGGGDSIVVYVFKVVSKRAFARRFFRTFVESVRNVGNTFRVSYKP